MTDTVKDENGGKQLAVRSRAFSLLPQSLGEAKEIATLIANSDFAPKDYKGKPDNVLVAIQMGADLGLKPLQALQNIAVINGRPSIYGDAALALAMDVLETFEESFEGTFPNDDFTAICVSKRKGWPAETRTSFSIAEAKTAKLWGKRGRDGQDTPWITYPKRMLQWRARGFNLRNVASDRLLGLVLVEEAEDYPDPHAPTGEPISVSPGLTIFEKLPDAFKETIEKAFATLNIPGGARLAKLNEYFTADRDPEESAQALLDWLKDEYAKRKTGQPRKRKGAENAKAAPVHSTTVQPAPPAPAPDPPVAQSAAPAKAPKGKAAVAEEALF